MNFIIGIICLSLGLATISYRYQLYKITGDWDWAVRFLGPNGTLLVIILAGMIMIFIGFAYPFGVFDNVNPIIVPVGIR